MFRRALASLLGLVVIGCGSQLSPPPSVSLATAPPSDSPSPNATPLATVAPSKPAAPLAWTRVMSVGDGASRTVAGPIVYGAAGFLMVTGSWRSGGEEGGPGGLHQRLWTSADGLAWHELDMPDAAAGFVIYQLIAADDGAFVAYGYHAKRVRGSEVAAFRSADGRQWQEVQTGLPPGTSVQAIETGPAGYLLVGGQTAETNPTLWLSANGLQWELVHEFRQSRRWVQIHDADGGDEGYVVLGRRIPADGDYERFAFASADGRHWINRDQPFGPDDQEYVFEANVSSRGGDWIATLGRHDAPTTTWFSANGLDWTEVGLLRAAPATGAGVFQEVGGRVLLSPGSGSWEGVPGVWSSTDGSKWAREAFGSRIWLGGVAQGAGVVAVTGTVTGADFTSTMGVWVKGSHE